MLVLLRPFVTEWLQLEFKHQHFLIEIESLAFSLKFYFYIDPNVSLFLTFG